MSKTVSFPVPVHPNDYDKPQSIIQLELSPGRVFSIVGIPLQGRDTIENILKTLEIWKPTLLKHWQDYEI